MTETAHCYSGEVRDRDLAAFCAKRHPNGFRVLAECTARHLESDGIRPQITSTWHYAVCLDAVEENAPFTVAYHRQPDRRSDSYECHANRYSGLAVALDELVHALGRDTDVRQARRRSA